jgi:hypothetical protein
MELDDFILPLLIGLLLLAIAILYMGVGYA